MATYVCSDIHGLQDRYDTMMNKLQPGDHLYILGDVVDRGPHGTQILWDVMHQPQVTMLLGNHEYMMKQYYEAKRKRDALNLDHFEVMSRWWMNHCDATIKGFDQLNREQQDQLLAFLDCLPVAICDVQVNGALYYLVHGHPVTELKKGVISQQAALDMGYEIESFVWNRVQTPQPFFADRTVILGHTPTLYLQADKPYAIWTANAPLAETRLINIDCGCAADNEHTRLALLRLEDRAVFYF